VGGRSSISATSCRVSFGARLSRRPGDRDRGARMIPEIVHRRAGEGEFKRDRTVGAVAEAGTRVIHSFDRYEVRPLVCRVTEDQCQQWPRPAPGDRRAPQARAWEGSRSRQRTGRLDTRWKHSHAVALSIGVSMPRHSPEEPPSRNGAHDSSLDQDPDCCRSMSVRTCAR
jgi:hypothetical protein